jgi:hypothetical protein
MAKFASGDAPIDFLRAHLATLLLAVLAVALHFSIVSPPPQPGRIVSPFDDPAVVANPVIATVPEVGWLLKLGVFFFFFFFFFFF